MSKKILTFVFRPLPICAFAVMSLAGCGSEEADRSAELIQHGSMHETIGNQQHQARVDLAEILAKPHFYGVGALESLRGEITILDSGAVITGVSQDGKAEPIATSGAKATMLVGQSISQWMDLSVTRDIPAGEFDENLGAMAEGKGVDVTKPFAFVVEGEFTDVRLHVINGACPIRARMKKTETEKAVQPYELEVKKVKGTLVGIYAKNSVGELTHPSTSIHAHLIYNDAKSGKRMTGHIEAVGLMKGGVIKLPKSDG